MIDNIRSNTYYEQKAPYAGHKVLSQTDAQSMHYQPQQFEVEEVRKKTSDAVVDRLLEEEEKKSDGVELELSGYAPVAEQAVSKEEEITASTVPEVTFSQRIKILFRDIKQAFLRFLGADVEVVGPEDVTVEQAQNEPADQTAMPDSDRTKTASASEQSERADKSNAYQIRQELYESLYENGAKKLAKNSTLLTAYDKRGSLVQMDADEKNRILHMHPHKIDEVF